MQKNQMHKKIIIFLFTICVSFSLHSALFAEEQKNPVLSLAEALEIAVANYAKVKEATEKLNSATFESQSAKADLYPKISANYSYTGLAEEPTIQINGMPPTAQIASTNQFHWDVTLVQPLFTGYALSTRYDITKLGIEIKEKEKQQVILDVTQGVKSAYYKVLLTQKLLFVAEDTIESLQSHERNEQRFYDMGVTRLNDLLRAKVALSNAVQNRERAQAAAKMAVSDLNRWLSFDINQDTQIHDIDTVPSEDYQLEELIRQGMENRPLLQAFHLSLETLEKAIKLEKSSYYPEVALIGGYEQNGDEPLASSNDFSNEYNAFVSVEAKWTFFDSSKTRSKVNKTKADKRAFLETIRSTEDGIKLEIKNAYLNLKVAEKNIENSKITIAQAEENLRVTRLGYRQQAATSTEVLDARTDLTQAQTNYFQALYGYLDALANLERAIGLRPESG